MLDTDLYLIGKFAITQYIAHSIFFLVVPKGLQTSKSSI